jgi:hypothetical protein
MLAFSKSDASSSLCAEAMMSDWIIALFTSMYARKEIARMTPIMATKARAKRRRRLPMLTEKITGQGTEYGTGIAGTGIADTVDVASSATTVL